MTPGASRPTSALLKPAAVEPIDGGRFPTLSGVESVNKRPSARKIAPLYEERFEHDACGVGFVADAGGRSRERVLPLALAGLAAHHMAELALHGEPEALESAVAPATVGRASSWSDAIRQAGRVLRGKVGVPGV